MTQQQKLLITGAGGFVGHHAIREFSDYNVIAFSNEPVNVQQNKLLVVEGDILDKNHLNAIIGSHIPDVVLHLAAVAATWERKYDDVLKVNMTGTKNIYEAIIEARKDRTYNPKVIYVSSSEVYGLTTTPESIKETCPIFPSNPYAASKAAAEAITQSFAHSGQIEAIVARPFTHTGVGQRKGFFVPDMASQIAEIEKDSKKSKLKVGNLNAIRDFLDVKDVVKAYRALIETKIEPGEVFNICSGYGRKMEDILNILMGISNKKIEVVKEESRMRQSEVPIFVGNNKKIRKITKWEPKIDITTTLSNALDDWRSKTTLDD